MPKKAKQSKQLRSLVERRGAVARLRAVGCSVAHIAAELGISRATVDRDVHWLQESGHASVASAYLTEIYDVLYLMSIDAARDNDWRKFIQLARCMVDVDKHNSGGALGEVIEVASMAAVAEHYMRAALQGGLNDGIDSDRPIPAETESGPVIAGSGRVIVGELTA